MTAPVWIIDDDRSIRWVLEKALARENIEYKSFASADEAEREVLEWKKVIFMRDRVGESFSGVVTGVMPFGLFVELDEFFVQGLVPIATIGTDYWQFREREHRLRGESSHRELRLGDHVVVEVKSIDEDRRQIEFRLVEAGGAPIATRER